MQSIISISKCPICNGKEYIFHISEDGYESAEPCECLIAKWTENWLRHSGIDYEEYQTKNLGTFFTDCEMAEKMKDNAVKFLADKEATGCGYFGKSGIGKTHICIAISQELTKKRKLPHKYFAYRAEIQKLKATMYQDEAYQELMYKWTNCPILYIDDFLKFATNKDGIQTQDLQIMFDIINSRYINKKITIFSSELTVKEISNIDEALGSRIYAMIEPYGLKCDGKNRRL